MTAGLAPGLDADAGEFKSEVLKLQHTDDGRHDDHLVRSVSAAGDSGPSGERQGDNRHYARFGIGPLSPLVRKDPHVSRRVRR